MLKDPNVHTSTNVTEVITNRMRVENLVERRGQGHRNSSHILGIEMK